MTDDEIEKMLEEIRNKVSTKNIDGPMSTVPGGSVMWNLDTSPIVDTTSMWSPTIAPLTTTQIHNMGIGTTGSSAVWATTNNFNFDLEKSRNKEFETHMPGLHKMDEMREMFPAFKKAYDHMRTVYDLVHDEYLERKKAND
jgi:hypothetical protein